MDVRDLVRGHYGAVDLTTGILQALHDAGADTSILHASDLYPVDHLHAGGPDASRHLLDSVEVGAGTRLLDVGCGIGGPARMAASYDALVSGVDLTPEFVDTATELTRLVGLSEKASFTSTPAEALPFEDHSFDTAMMIHVGMNVPGKQALFAEVHRVLRPGGRFALFEQMRAGDGDLPYPMPWAEDERSSFVETPEAYVAHLEAVGFSVERREDRTASTAGPPAAGRLSPVAVFGPAFAERIGNNIAATRAGLLVALLLVARA